MKKVISTLIGLYFAFSVRSQIDSSKWALMGSYYLPIVKQEYPYTEYKQGLGSELKVTGYSFSGYRSVVNRSKWKYQVGFGIDVYSYKFNDLPYLRESGITYYEDLIGSQYMFTLNNRLIYSFRRLGKHRNCLALDLRLGLLQYERKSLFENNKEEYSYTNSDIANPLYLNVTLDYGFDLLADKNKNSLMLLLGAGTFVSDGIDFYKFSLNGRVGLAYVW